jgi:hypothetical protein
VGDVKVKWSDHVAKVHKKREQANEDFEAKHAEHTRHDGAS